MLSQSEILSDPQMGTFICLHLRAGQVAYRPTSMCKSGKVAYRPTSMCKSGQVAYSPTYMFKSGQVTYSPTSMCNQVHVLTPTLIGELQTKDTDENDKIHKWNEINQNLFLTSVA